jgi:hypothetical protein
MTHAQQSVLYSIIFHGLVILCMFAIKFQMETFPIREYIEIIAMDIVPPTPPRPQVVTSPPVAQSAPVTPESTLPPSPARPPAPQNVSTPTVTNPDLSPVDISNLPTRGERVITSPFEYETNLDPSLGISQNHTATTGTPPATTTRPGVNVPGLGDQIRANLTGSSNFHLAGEAVNRSVINGPLPVFPDGIQETGTVTIDFTISASGIVQNPVVTRKSLPEFESVALAALRQWVFNQSDRSHTGQITFNFILR